MIDVNKSVNEILNINDSYKAPDRIMELLRGDKKKRDQVFKDMAYLFGHDYSFDWFHEYFQIEHSDRIHKKQYFTPKGISELVNKLVGEHPGHTSLDVASGTGGLLITRWHQDRLKSNPFIYKPSDYFYHAEELSDRSLPFLLFNIVIRGMNAVVVHGDTLTRECYGVFFIQNDHNDHMLYSSLNVFPYTEETEKMFSVKFVEERYEPLIQTPGIPKFLIDGVDRKQDEEVWNLVQKMLGLNLKKDRGN